MNLNEYHYDLPQELVAQEPLAERDASRMLVVDRRSGSWQDRVFRDLPEFLGPGDCLALNDSRVFPSRLLGRREGHVGRVQVFLLRPLNGDAREWEALVRPGRKLPVGSRIEITPSFVCEITGRGSYGERKVRLDFEGDIWEALDQIGHTPLPLYIHRPDEASDRERYQTVYATKRGSVAAPTAGLHFTPGVLERCRAAGAEIACLTLHVGLGTFQPVHEVQIASQELHQERYWLDAANAAQLAAAKRIIAVGTTAVRTLETVAYRGGLSEQSGDTGLFILPGFEFRLTGAMLTNFHLPSTSLMLLVSAFAGRDLILAAYQHAVREKYRFYSYGDCMLIT